MSAARTGVSSAVVLAAISFYGGFAGVAQAGAPGLSDAIGSSAPAPVQAATGPVVQTVQQTVAPLQQATTATVVHTAQQTAAPVQQAATAPVVKPVLQTMAPVQQATTAPSLAAPAAAVATMAGQVTATVNQNAAAAARMIGSTASNTGSAAQSVLNVAGAATSSTAGLLKDTTAGALTATTSLVSHVTAAPTTAQPVVGSLTGSMRPGSASQVISAPAAPTGSAVAPQPPIFSPGSVDYPSAPTGQGPAPPRDRAAGPPTLAGWVATTTGPPNLFAGKTSRGSPTPIPHLPRLPFPGFISASGGGAGGSLLAFAILLSILLLVTPKAGRRLRPALALELSPAYLAARERPG
jgi:hypothetical protein